MTSDKELIDRLEKEIGKKLEVLRFSEISGYRNNGYSIDKEGRVTGLNLDEIPLAETPSSLLLFTRIRKLRLSGTKLKDFSFLEKLTSLTVLGLIDNQLADLSVLKGLVNLTDLYLAGNPLTCISGLETLKELRILSLYNNQLSDISAIKELSRLTQLDLDSNQLTDISPLEGLKNIRYLYLNSNRLTDISPLAGLKQLQSLILIENKIKEIPREFFSFEIDINVENEQFLPEEKGIYLAKNPIETPPLEILRKGKQAALAYFDSVTREKTRRLNEVKVLLVGDGYAGKTSLVKRLLFDDFDANEPQTHGIKIDTWGVRDNDRDISAHMWDFGGQQIMHATHQFFLSKRSLYILVLDARKDDKADERTEHWLHMIRSFGGDSPVLVVTNKIDQNPDFTLNRKALREKFHNIKEFYRISCMTGEGLEQFRPALKHALGQIEILDTTWPQNWFNVKKQLENMPVHFISYDEYREICTGEDITRDNDRETLVDFLNDLGVILYFPTLALQDTHVLEPGWATEAVYKIINSKKYMKHPGVLDLDNLDHILGTGDKRKGEETGFVFPKNKHFYIMELMRKFELCYPLDDTGGKKVLIPDLLDVEEPALGMGLTGGSGGELDFEFSKGLQFYFQYDFLPKSVMPRFMVRMYKHIFNSIQWRTGVVLVNAKTGAAALIKSDEAARRLYISVTGNGRRDFFSYIRLTLRGINETFQKLSVTEWIPLTKHPDTAVDYDELVGLEIMGEPYYTAGKLKRKFPVADLLNGYVSDKEKQGERSRFESKSIHFKRQEGDFNLYLQQNVTQNVEQNVEQNVNIEINLKVELPALQEEFEHLRQILVNANPGLNNRLKEIQDSLDNVGTESDKEKFTNPLNKVRRFLSELGKKDSATGKIARGIESGLETARKTAEIYNKFARWLPGVPTIPDDLIKD